MADDIYAQFGDIEGESTDEDHKKWSSLDSVTHSLQNQSSGDRSTGGGGSAGVASHGEIAFTKQFDASSPGLIKACTNGTHIDIKIDVCKQTGDEKVPFINYELGKAYISSLSHDTAGKDGKVIEHGTINYLTIKWTYDKVDSEGHSEGKMEASWNRKTNKEKV